MTTLVKINSDGSKVYPYGLAELRREFPNTSFSAKPSSEELSHYKVYYVEPSTQPDLERYQKLQFDVVYAGNDLYREQWTAVAMSAEEKQLKDDTQAGSVRHMRNKLLADCDWTQLEDAPADAGAWAAYRQKLRDVSKQAGFPWDVNWPQQP